MRYTAKSEITDPFLYRLYWGLMLEDLLTKLNAEITPKNKQTLHEFNKKVLGYTSISGRSKEFVSLFIYEMTAWWAVEQGIFVRSSGNQPPDIENRSFLEVKDLL